MNINVEKYSDLQSLSSRVALRTSEVINMEVDKKGWCSVVLCGGNTPGMLYECFSDSGFALKIPWEKVYFFWGDERCVPVDHSESNFNMAYSAFLSDIKISKSNIYRMRGEIEPPEQAAVLYEKMIRRFFKLISGKSEEMFPVFDLVFLGMGPDGHTASLFPGCPAVDEKKKWVVPSMAPHGYIVKKRITLTLPVLNNAKRVFFLVSGKEKQKIFNEIIYNTANAIKMYPAARVKAKEELVWFVAGFTECSRYYLLSDI